MDDCPTAGDGRGRCSLLMELLYVESHQRPVLVSPATISWWCCRLDCASKHFEFLSSMAGYCLFILHSYCQAWTVNSFSS